MNENGQNGPKVFASIAKFGETKFKPIRKQENSSDQQNHHPALGGKQNSASTGRMAAAENLQQAPARGRVNKFFKSRNPVSVLEETNKPKPAKPANITSIQNETKFNEKPLKMKIKKEKERTPKKTTASEKQQSPAKPAAPTPPAPKAVPPPRPESPEFISKSPPPNYSNQTRYGTRSRRCPDQVENEPDTKPVKLVTLVKQVENEPESKPAKPVKLVTLVKQIENEPESKPAKPVKLVKQIENQPEPIENHQPQENSADRPVANKRRSAKQQTAVPASNEENKTHQYGTRRSSRRKVGSEPTGETAIELGENHLKKLKLDCNEPDLKEDHGQMDFEMDAPPAADQNEDQQNDNHHDFDQPLQHVASQPAVDDQLPPLSTAAPLLDKPTASLPTKKRFFSKNDRKAVQYNAKNFFSQDDQVNEFGENANDPSADRPVKPLLEYDSDKLKKVKEAHKCAELGEAEHFDGEISFYLSGIKDRNATPKVRCLNILGLTTQCLNKPELRMHLRAHDYMGKIIRALMDSPRDPNLALCAACLMFVYNQDRMTFDIDPNALSLMLELLETKADQDVTQIDQKHKEKIIEMCQAMKTKGHGKYLKLNEISAGTLAMETLLGLTGKRAGDWFKEELRARKGIDYLVDAILSSSADHCNAFMQQEGELNKIDRSLRVIENVTYQNRENQEYVINYREHAFVQRCCRLYELCKEAIVRGDSSNNSHLSPLLSILRVFTNLTADVGQEAVGRIGDSVPDVFDIFLNSIFELPSFVVPDSRFDLIIFLLCLCLNLVESCDRLHGEFINNQSQIRRLVAMLEERYEEAKKTEQQADDFLDSEETQRQLNAETINMDSILTDLVAKSSKHMTHTIIAACISLLIGCGLKDNYEQVESVRRLLPNQSFAIMIEVITKLKEFSNLASIMTPSGIQRVDSILSVLKQISK